MNMLEFVIGYTAGAKSAGRASALSSAMSSDGGSHHTTRIEDLNERVDKLAMIVKAMWSLMEEQGVSPEQLIAKLEEIDGADGELDGQVTRSVKDCRSCGSKVAAGLPNCQFCGAAVQPDEDEHPIGHV